MYVPCLSKTNSAMLRRFEHQLPGRYVRYKTQISPESSRGNSILNRLRLQVFSRFKNTNTSLIHINSAGFSRRQMLAVVMDVVLRITSDYLVMSV